MKPRLFDLKAGWTVIFPKVEADYVSPFMGNTYFQVFREIALRPSLKFERYTDEWANPKYGSSIGDVWTKFRNSPCSITKSWKFNTRMYDHNHPSHAINDFDGVYRPRYGTKPKLSYNIII